VQMDRHEKSESITSVQKKISSRDPSAHGVTMNPASGSVDLSTHYAGRYIINGSYPTDQPLAPIPIPWAHARIQMNALLIEDNLVLAKITIRSLEAMHFANVDVAHDGDEALRFLSSHTYDLIVVDWMLPKASGLDIVRTIKASKEHASTPIIMTTGKNDRQDIVMALQTGVDAYLVKPISPAVLTERVGKVLSL